MFKGIHGFGGFSVNDLAAAKTFYGEILGLNVTENEMGVLRVEIGGDNFIVIYPKDNHEPATFTVLNFPVENIDDTISELKTRGITLEHYEGLTDETGVARGIAANRGPDIAWFKDPAGNILSVLQN